MPYDLLIRNGAIIDGSGAPRYRADVAIQHGRIASIGRIRDGAAEVIDADGLVVAPGFVDGHTHMDAQISWDPLGTCSCWQGVTSVVMGNCGFTLAPCHPQDRELYMNSLQRVEDIPVAAMAAGIDWTWQTFPEYLDRVEELPKGINYAAYVGHTALRLYAMGERALTEQASEDELTAMRREVRDALRAGAIGFTTSRSPSHETPDSQPVPSRAADWEEVRQLVGVMGEMNAGIFEIAPERHYEDREAERDYHIRLRDLAVETGRPISWGIFSRRAHPSGLQPQLDLLEETAQRGGRMFGQAHTRPINIVLSFQTQLPFDHFPVWRELRARPLDEQRTALRDPDTRRRLVQAAHDGDSGRRALGGEARPPDYDWIFAFDSVEGPHPSIAQLARERGQDPVDVMIDLALDKDLDAMFLQSVANEDQDEALAVMKNPRCVVTFSDSGAHVSQIMDSSLQTHLLSHWVREKQAFTLEEAVRLITFDTASAWGLHDRGLVREGWAADLTIFDPDRIAPLMPEVTTDLPAGATRLRQKATGIAATVVNGQVLLRDGEHTGALPGRLLRGPAARR